MTTCSKILTLIGLLTLITLVGCQDDENIQSNQKNGLVAVAGEDKNSKVNEEIQLDGSASYDKNNKPFTYLWLIKSKPQGSTATPSVNNAAKTTFTPDKAGLYLIQLSISQGSWNAKDELVVVVTSDDPNGPETVVLDQSIVNSTTLNDIFEDPAQPDYLVTTDLEVRADLIISPGVVIAFEENKSLQIINGSIRAIGNAGKGITFKGLEDRPGYWKGVIIYSNSEQNELNHVTIQHGGSSNFSESVAKANLSLLGTLYSGAALTIRHSNFNGSGGHGVYVQGMSSLTEFSDNTFNDNVLAAAYIPARELHKIGTAQFSGNWFNGIETGGTLSHDTEVVWKKPLNGAYYVSSDIAVKSGVTIEAGTVFKMKRGVTLGISENGYLNAVGSETSRIVFTSFENNGSWNGLFFNTSSTNNRLDYCEVSNAGLNKITGAEHQANIAIGIHGTVEVKNSVIKNGLGYGIAAKSSDRFNSDVVSANAFENLQKGNVFPANINHPDQPALTGVWLDAWSFKNGGATIRDDFYNKQTGVWFGGATSPWDMTSAAFGIRFDENGSFTWTIAERSPVVECISYSAEYITGEANIQPGTVSFDQKYWRSKFTNSCDETQNVDTNITPFELVLPYQINKMYDLFTGEQYWELKFTNPDQSSFSYYRK